MLLHLVKLPQLLLQNRRKSVFSFICAFAFSLNQPRLQTVAADPPQLKFETAKPDLYNVRLDYQGYIPIFGGMQGNASAVFDLMVAPEHPESDPIKVLVSLKTFVLKFNDAIMPVSLQDAQKYFGNTDFMYEPDGSNLKAVEKTSLPPIRLPGLDMDHVPSISFLPCRLPSKPGQSLTYTDKIPNGSQTFTVQYAVDSTNASLLNFTIKTTSSSVYYQDVSDQVVDNKTNADATVKSSGAGSGTAVFDNKTHRFIKFDMVDTTTNLVTPIHGGTTLHHNLKRIISVKTVTALSSST